VKPERLTNVEAWKDVTAKMVLFDAAFPLNPTLRYNRYQWILAMLSLEEKESRDRGAELASDVFEKWLLGNDWLSVRRELQDQLASLGTSNGKVEAFYDENQARIIEAVERSGLTTDDLQWRSRIDAQFMQNPRRDGPHIPLACDKEHQQE
jgi:hypothetical protein